MPNLQSKRIILTSNINQADFKALKRWFNDVEAIQYFPSGWELGRLSASKLKDFFKTFETKNKHHHYFYILNKKGNFLGYIMYKDTPLTIGLFIGKPHWNKGYGFDAMKLFLTYFFKSHRLSRLSTCRKNSSALHLYKKLGYQIVEEVPNAHNYYVRHGTKVITKKTIKLRLDLRRKDFYNNFIRQP